MGELAFININNLKDKREIFIFNNKFKSNYWNFDEFHKSKSASSVVINFDVSFYGIKLIDHPALLDEIKTVIYNRFKSGLKIRTNVSYFLNLKPFIKFMFQKNIFHFKDLKYSDLEEYQLSTKKINTSAVNGLFTYRSNTDSSILFKPYFGHRKRDFSDQNNQTRVFKEEDWKNICLFAEKTINDFLVHESLEIEYDDFIIDSYNKSGSFGLVKGRFFSKFKKRFGVMKNKRSDAGIAAALLIQAYTGMRLSEILSLKRNCINVEEILINNEKVSVFKIKGRTFKYRNSNGELEEEGVDVTWYCPEIVVNAVSVLKRISNIAYVIHNVDDLFVNPKTFSKLEYRTRLNYHYNVFLSKNNIVNFKINSHMFRRTLARFFAKSVLDIPVEALKEQYKHFDKSITHYYMRDTERADNSFIELMEEYSKEVINGNQNKKKELSSFIKKNIKEAIISANNLEELDLILDSKKIEVVNDYMVTIKKENGKLSPIECLTCEGNLILPELHLDYWKEMKTLYEELILSEPNSFWYNKEYNLIKEVVDQLKSNKAYITKGTTE